MWRQVVMLPSVTSSRRPPCGIVRPTGVANDAPDDHREGHQRPKDDDGAKDRHAAVPVGLGSELPPG